MAILVHDVKQGTPEWHELRSGLITASNAAVLLKRGARAAVNSEGGSSAGGYWSERGHILEEEALEILAKVTESTIERPGFITNDKYPTAGYSPDGVIKTDWLPVEVKCFKGDKHLACLKETPLEVYAQVQFGLMVAESSGAYIVFYNPDLDDLAKCFVIRYVERDEKLIERFKQKLTN